MVGFIAMLPFKISAPKAHHIAIRRGREERRAGGACGSLLLSALDIREVSAGGQDHGASRE
jgi:hypothetical protein